ncbi:PTS sugar transporter subunit IIA [Lactovum miscens]|uniref:Mannitol-specific phosphotransferase enzyme IIA component n=1 Tax=Lactovum miscens TaxID=190387 RepID=A0A841C9N0_9LACT|nr:PTS sugar transporter subunit IIA [Lactovum miscens]MBB5888428.1 PTS system mannitol-specific IIC component [Lactovum miscens]
MNETVSLKVRVQKVGTFLSNMVMPNIPILIAWGFLTSIFLTPGGWIDLIWPSAASWTGKIAIMIGPMLTYLIPIMIAYTGGKTIYEHRGGVVGAVSAFGAIIATATTHQGGANPDIWKAGDVLQTAITNAGIITVHAAKGSVSSQNVTMILGAMILGPLGAWLIKKFDAWAQPRTKVGLEMLVNNFSAGFMAMFIAIFAVFIVGPVIGGVTNVLSAAVDVLQKNNLIALTNIFVDPAKILFLNNAINYGILAPIGLGQVAAHGFSNLFMIENNPGPGLGVLLAFWIYGKSTAKASAPGAIIIQFIGGIHEIYFPFVMMKPALFLSVALGGVTGTLTTSLLHVGTVGPAAPGSIIALIGVSLPNGNVGNLLGILLAVALSALVSFLISAFIIRRDKSTDEDLEAAQEAVADAKAVAKGKTTTTNSNAAANFSGVKHVIFACDAGMGSSAMGASILRDKVKKAGLPQDVTNVAVANLVAGPDAIVVTQAQLAERARQKAPDAIRYQVDNFMASPVYDQVVNELLAGATGNSVEVVEGEVEEKKAFKLDHNLIKINQEFATKEDAIRFCGQLLVDGGYVKPEYVPAMIKRNEDLSVYMGNSIAIPHGTDEAKKDVLKTGITIVQVPKGVNFGDEKNEQIATVLFGIAGIGNEHLDLIQRISIFCSDLDNVAKLADAKSVEEIAAYFED